MTGSGMGLIFEDDLPETEDLIPESAYHVNQSRAFAKGVQQIMKLSINNRQGVHLLFAQAYLKFFYFLLQFDKFAGMVLLRGQSGGIPLENTSNAKGFLLREDCA